MFVSFWVLLDHSVAQQALSAATLKALHQIQDYVQESVFPDQICAVLVLNMIEAA